MAEQKVGMVALKDTLKNPSIVNKFEEMLGKRAPQFMTSITSVVGNNDLLKKADVNSIIMGAALSASMDLPLNPNLGYAALVPFNSKNGCFAQLQIMSKGWVELFLRSGQCQTLVNEVVYEGQLVKKNKFTGEYVFDDDAKISDTPIGFMAYFKLTNGYEKTVYWTVEEVKAHAAKYSQTYRKGYGIWKDCFESMSLKTVLKSLIVKYAPKSIEVQRAIVFDQSVVSGEVNNLDKANANYVDRDASVQNVETADFEEIDEEVVDMETGEILEPNA